MYPARTTRRVVLNSYNGETVVRFGILIQDSQQGVTVCVTGIQGIVAVLAEVHDAGEIGCVLSLHGEAQCSGEMPNLNEWLP